MDLARGVGSRRTLVLEDEIQTRLVARDAGVDAVGCVRVGLLHPVGVGQEGASHRHHIGIAAGEDLLGDVRHVDAVGGDQGNGDLAAEPRCDPGVGGPGDHGRDGGDARLVPADARVDDAGPGLLDGLRELDDLGPCGAVLHQVQHREAVDDDEIVAHSLADSADDLDGELNPRGVVAAPLVRALVGLGDDELVDEVALGPHDLDAVVARLLRSLGAVDVVGDGLLYTSGGERTRLEGGDGRLQCGRGHRPRRVGVATRVEDLHGDVSTLRTHGIGDCAVLPDLVAIGELGREGLHAASEVGGHAAGHDETHSSRCSRSKVRSELV